MEVIKPLKKSIYDKAKELGILKIILNFSGGSDEGYLNIDFDIDTGFSFNDKTAQFEKEVEDWAWSVYQYSGAGDGSDYGDDITYDLENNTASCSEWYTERTEGDTSEIELKTDDQPSNDEDEE